MLDSGNCVYDACSGTAYTYSFDKKALSKILTGETKTFTPEKTLAQALHFALIHMHWTDLVREVLRDSIPLDTHPSSSF